MHFAASQCPPESNALHDSDIDSALFLLHQWLQELRHRRLAMDDPEGTIRLCHDVTCRFGIGFHSNSAFMAFPSEEAEWAALIPWSHVSIRRNSDVLHLVSKPIERGAHTVPTLGFSLVCDSASQVRAVGSYDELDLRTLLAPLQKSRCIVSRTPFASIPILHVEDNVSVLEPPGADLASRPGCWG